MTPLFIDPSVRTAIASLIAQAESKPVQMKGLTEKLQTPQGKAKHMAQMTEQTIHIPLAFQVTFSIEHHPCGTCRHLSMSVQRKGRAPNPPAVWMVAQEFGFWGTLEQCSIWTEDLAGHGTAVNVVQPLTNPTNH